MFVVSNTRSMLLVAPASVSIGAPRSRGAACGSNSEACGDVLVKEHVTVVRINEHVTTGMIYTKNIHKLRTVICSYLRISILVHILYVTYFYHI